MFRAALHLALAFCSAYMGAREMRHAKCQRQHDFQPLHPPDKKVPGPKCESHLPGVERLLERLFVRERRVGLFQLGELDVHVLCVVAVECHLSVQRTKLPRQEVDLNKKGEARDARHCKSRISPSWSCQQPKELLWYQLVGRLIALNLSHHSRRLSLDGLRDCKQGKEISASTASRSSACTVCAPLFFWTVESLRGMVCYCRSAGREEAVRQAELLMRSEQA